MAADFVIALKPDKNPDAMLEERKNLAAALSKELGGDVEVIVPTAGAVIIEGLANGSIDAGYLSATDMVHARRARAADLLLVGEINGRRSYSSYWLALKGKPFASIEDLRGQPVAFASRTSTSGYLIPLADLHNRGLINKDPVEFFGEGNVWFGTGYASAVERVFAGEAEAAAVSDYVLEQDKHLTAEQRAQLKVVATQGPVPTHVIAVSSQLDLEKRSRLKSALLALGKSQPALRDAVFTSPLVEADSAEHLAPVEKALDFATDRGQ
jgi:phosphonate transport system substrate-binding protein